MTVWNEIEEALNRIPVKIRLTTQEAIAVREAQEWWTERTLNESSAWDALQVLSEMPSFKQRPGTGAGTNAIVDDAMCEPQPRVNGRRPETHQRA